MKKIITIIVICGAVLTLAFLGTWQVKRLVWKNQIIDNLNAEYQKDPNQNIYDIADLTALFTEENSLVFGRVNGQFSAVTPLFLKPKTHDSKVGAHVIHPFNLSNGGSILVNRGWIEEKDIQAFKSSTKAANITGIFRKPDWNRFTSNNSPSQNIWTKADINQMANFYKIENFAPVLLYATEIKGNDGLILQDTKWYPRNKHLQYAFFWYGMIFVLLTLVAIALRKQK